MSPPEQCKPKDIVIESRSLFRFEDQCKSRIQHMHNTSVYTRGYNLCALIVPVERSRDNGDIPCISWKCDAPMGNNFIKN